MEAKFKATQQTAIHCVPGMVLGAKHLAVSGVDVLAMFQGLFTHGAIYISVESVCFVRSVFGPEYICLESLGPGLFLILSVSSVKWGGGSGTPSYVDQQHGGGGDNLCLILLHESGQCLL